MDKIKFFLNYWLIYFPMVLAAFLCFRILNRLTLKGCSNIPESGGLLVMANHISALDSWLVGHVLFPRRVFFPAKSELFRGGITRIFFSLMGAFPVTRGRHNERTMRKITEISHNGTILMHPEGTRSMDGKVRKGMRGIGKIIYESKVPVLPVYHGGVQNVLPKGAFFPHFGKEIEIIVGEPMDFSEFRKEEASKEVYTEISDILMDKIRELAGQ